MKEDISNYSPTVMFRGTPCSLRYMYLSIKKSRHLIKLIKTLIHIIIATDYSEICPIFFLLFKI